MSKRAILYARVSGDDRQNVTSSIDGQLELCRDYASKKGYKIIGEHFEERDKHTSGADWLPELDRILTLSQNGNFDVLIVRGVDRLARNRFKQLSVKTALNRAGVSIEYVTQQFPDTPEGRLLEGIMGEFAEFEKEEIRKRIINGINRSVTAGNVKLGVKNAPYGYILARVDGLRTLAENESEAAIIRIIYDMYVNQGYTIYAILTWLNEHKIPKPSKAEHRRQNSTKEEWGLGTLNAILSNETFVGRWYYGKTTLYKDERTNKWVRVEKPREQWILVNVPAIISEDIFQAAQRRRDENKRTMGKQNRRVYALGGMLTCGHCGKGIAGITHGIYPYYICASRHNSKRFGIKCDNCNYSVKDTDMTIWQWVKSILLDPERLREALRDYQGGKTALVTPMLTLVTNNEARLGELQKEKDRLIKAYSAGVLTLNEIAIQKTSLDKQIADLQQATHQLKTEIGAAILTEGEIESIEYYASLVREGADIADNDPRLQRTIYRLLELKVTLSLVEGEKWADVTCILGDNHLPAEFSPKHSIVNRWEMRARLLIDGDNSLVTAFFARVGQPVNA